jgi:hypothetical protein
MDNILSFKKKNHLQEISKQEMQTMTKEDFEFLEDMLSNFEMASPDEVDFECDDGFCITKNFDVKLSPSIKNEYLYLQARNKQKRNHHIGKTRKNTLKLL